MISNEQMDILIGRLKVYGSETGRGKDHPNAIACRTAAAVIIEQQAEIERLRKALEFYADPKIYEPHPHGPAFDRRDVSYVARVALEDQ